MGYECSTQRRWNPSVEHLSFRQRIYSGRSTLQVFTAYNRDWLLFIVDAREGADIADSYDYVEGGVANDRVVDTVNLYIAGLMDIDTALQRLALHQPNNQMCLLSQSLIDKYLIYNGTTEI